MRFDLNELKPHDRYKLIAGLVVPRPIALVTTVGENGGHNAAPYSFFNAFSEEIRTSFKARKILKPRSSRRESKEIFIIGLGFQKK